MRSCVISILVLGACTADATARLELSNKTPQARRVSAATGSTSLELKILAVYLAEDIEPTMMSNVGQTAMIWLNPQCEDDIAGCNVSGFTQPPGGPRVTDYFEIARPSAEVNADLNGQGLPVTPGTYRHVHVELCKGSPDETVPGEPRLHWQGTRHDRGRAVRVG